MIAWQEMVRYYFALHSVLASLKYDEAQIKALSEDDRRLMEIQYEDVLARAEKLIRAAPPKSAPEQTIETVEGIHEVLGFLDKLRELFGGG